MSSDPGSDPPMTQRGSPRELYSAPHAHRGSRRLARALAPAAAARGRRRAPARPNIVLITSTPRAPTTSAAWGWRVRATPQSGRAGARAACASSAATPRRRSPCRSHATILTGLFPPRHGVRDNGTFVLARPVRRRSPSGWPRRGYDTAAVVSAVVLARRHGLDQGSAIYDDDLGAGLRRRHRGERAPGRARRPTAALAAARRSARAVLPLGALLRSARGVPAADRASPTPRTGPHRLYDGEIAYMDAEIGRLLAALPQDDGRRGGGRSRRDAGRARRDDPRPAALRRRAPGAAAARRPRRARPGAVEELPGAHRRRRADAARARRRAVRAGLDGESLLPLARRATAAALELQRELPAVLRLQVVSAARPLRRPLPLSCRRREPASTARRRSRGGARPRGRAAAGARALVGRAPARACSRPGEALEPEVRAENVLDDEQRAPAREPRLSRRRRRRRGARASCPTRASAIGHRARLHAAAEGVQQGRCPEVLRELQEIVRDDPHNFPALKLAGQCLRAAGRRGATRSRSSSGRAPRTSFGGAGGQRRRQPAAARAARRRPRREYRRALALDPTQAEAAANLARLLRERGDRPGALRGARRGARRRQPRHAGLPRARPAAAPRAAGSRKRCATSARRRGAIPPTRRRSRTPRTPPTRSAARARRRRSTKRPAPRAEPRRSLEDARRDLPLRARRTRGSRALLPAGAGAGGRRRRARAAGDRAPGVAVRRASRIEVRIGSAQTHEPANAIPANRA